jgi:hypothetical protein
MEKSKKIYYIISFAVLLVLALIFVYFLKNMKIEEIAPKEINENIIEEIKLEVEEVEDDVLSLDDKEIISDFIKTNISDLSPEKEVLGGKFYVTEIEFVSNTLLKVDYEDGHIALVADVEFNFSINKELEIIEFKILTDEIGDNLKGDEEAICVDLCGNGICEEIVCMGSGCPCSENEITCPVDCK